MKVDVLHAAGCAKCLGRLPSLKAAARQADPEVEWNELDIVQALDYAVALGVLKPPVVAIDGQLAFSSLPTAEALQAAMRKRLGAAS